MHRKRLFRSDVDFFRNYRIAQFSKMAKQRAVADPSITVQQLEAGLTDAMKSYTSKDLDEVLGVFGDQVDWNRGSKPDLLALATPFFTPLVKLCSNGVLPTRKLELAITAKNSAEKLNFTSEVTEAFSNLRGVIWQVDYALCCLILHTRVFEHGVYGSVLVSYTRVSVQAGCN